VGFLAYRAKDALVLVRSFPDGVAKIVARDDRRQVVGLEVEPRGGFRFTLSDGDDREVLNRKLPRDRVLGFLAAPPACDVFGSNLRLRHPVGQCPLFACAVRRRRFPVGASPTRRTLQPEATGAVVEVTKWLKPSV
jgi:hypothetical protein